MKKSYDGTTYSYSASVSVASVLIPFYSPPSSQGCFRVHTIIHSASYFTRANKLRHGQYGYGDGEYNMNIKLLYLGRSVRYVTKCVAYHIKAALRCILQYEQTLLAILKELGLVRVLQSARQAARDDVLN